MLQLVLLLLPQRLLLHFRVQFRTKQGEGRSGPLIPVLTELGVEEGFLFTLTAEIFC